jgi:hypothetical protein
MSVENAEGCPKLPVVPHGPWKRRDGQVFVVVTLAHNPLDNTWNVVYIPQGGKGWEVYVEPYAEWSSKDNHGVAKYSPLGFVAEALTRRLVDDTATGSVLSTTVCAAYQVRENLQDAVEKNGQAAHGLGQALVNTFVANADKLRGNVTLTMFVQASCDGKVSDLVIAGANALPPTPTNRLPRG